MSTPIIRSFVNRNRKILWVVVLGVVMASTWSVALQVQAVPPQKQTKGVSRKRALLVGISRYPQAGKDSWKPLNTHQDIVQMKDALRVHGFAAEDVKVLEDGEATAEGIRAAFRSHLISPAKPGDTLLFHFSGHGQQVSDDNGDEIDGLDETLVPANATDQHAQAGAKTNLRDDEIGAWLKELGDKLRGPDGKQGGSIVVTLDSCFSGTAMRGDLVERGHGWDENLDGVKPPRRDTDRGAQLSASLQDKDGEVQFLSAALSTQTAKERNGMGVFSAALVQALKRADNQTTYQALLDDISYEMAQSGVREQTPGLEGNGDLILFGGEARKPERTTRILEVDGDTLTMAAGQLHLVTKGSIYAVHRAGTDKLGDGNKLGEAEVVSVGAGESVLRLKPNAQVPQNATKRTVLLGARVVEPAHRYADSPVRVRFVGLPVELVKVLRAIPVLTARDAAASDYDVEVRGEPKGIGLYRPESRAPFCVVAADATAQIESILRAEWRWRSVMNLRSNDAEAQVKLRIVPVQCPPGSPHKGLRLTERTDVPKTEPLRLHAGDCFQLELHNPTPNDLWTTVLQLSADGSIEPSFPHPRRFGEHLVLHRQTVRIPTPYVYKVELSKDRKHERSAFKVIATTEPLNLSPLIQHAYEISRMPTQNRGAAESELAQQRSSVSAKLGPLVQLLADTALGERKGTLLPTSLDAWGVTTQYLDQEVKP